MRKAAEELQHYAEVHDALTVLERPPGGRAPESEHAQALAAGLATFESVGVQYANPWHPNAIQGLCTTPTATPSLELVGHVRAENPGVDVRWIAPDELSPDDLTNHVIVLGGADSVYAPGRRVGALKYLLDRLDLPVATESAGRRRRRSTTASSSCGWTKRAAGPATARVARSTPPVRRRQQGGRVLDEGQPRLEYDVALLGRFANPLNLSATITICSGIFSRGTYGAVRALTDATLRARNERYLAGTSTCRTSGSCCTSPSSPARRAPSPLPRT